MGYKKGIKVLVIVLVILAIVAGIVLYNMYGTYKGIQKNPGGVFVTSGEDKAVASDNINYDENKDLTQVEFNGQKYTAKEDIVNVLLMGVDAASDRQDVGRTDMLMLCTMDMKNNKIDFLSIPRDTKTKVYHVGSDGKVTKEQTAKINAAYAYGGGKDKYSAENAMRATQDFLEVDGNISVPIDYYMSIDLDGLPKIADALGGVTVTLDQDMPEVGEKGEEVTLEGRKVRLYLQNRHDMDDGETTRQLHEQTFIKAMARDIKEMGAKAAAPKLFESFTKFMRTNLNLDQVVAFASVLDAAGLDQINFDILKEGHPEMSDAWYYIASQDEVLKLMLSRIYNAV
ncbi:MAG: LCP family protein [Christensenellaceae bacterium]